MREKQAGKLLKKGTKMIEVRKGVTTRAVRRLKRRHDERATAKR
jgi:hypothetical protein